MKVVLLDRDGTVVVEPPTFDVVLDGLAMFPDTIEALKMLADNGYRVVFVTNQTGITDRGLSMEEYEATNQKMLEMIKPSGIEVLKIYVCPHGRESTCECRKPRPGMLQQAIQEFDLDPKEIFMVGDNVTDVEAGVAAGTKTILLRQGIRHEETDNATYTADNLLEAAEYIVKH